MQKPIPLRERLMRYMLNNHTTSYIASGDLQRIVMQHTTYTPRTTVRRLQELFEDGKLEREIRKGHAFYRARTRAVDASRHVQASTSTFSKEEWAARHKILEDNKKTLAFFDSYQTPAPKKLV